MMEICFHIHSSKRERKGHHHHSRVAEHCRMDTLSSIACFSTSPKLSPRPPLFRKTPPSISLSRASAQPLSELAEDDVLRVFLRERQLNGDFISKACDKFWQRGVAEFDDIDIDELSDIPQESEQDMESDNNGGFLKLSRTQEWVLGENAAAPMNKKAIAKALQDDSDRRKRLNLLEYEALKRELALLSVGIGAACTGYCLVVLSVQAAVSYAIGVLFRIGIRSEDLRDSFERSIKGSGIALSSPRIVIPTAIYGLWVLSHQYFPNDIFEIQIVPAMFGMFVYKAAALVQVYRDNDDLKLVFPDSEEGLSD
ncbi:hypothetical protein SADUNF_Sadunf09G0129300 [Salix dunnii]|uniref:CGL160/ATPI domain-containing protein n=1 Tax=Salix dunnii TaxID=1413687 RepID=A0A835JTS1_9ROSI|nr:hypothetical protein SADUNF_Sadunf09G0129300 [Salix dunnii]